jgi:transcription termination factor Rho
LSDTTDVLPESARDSAAAAEMASPTPSGSTAANRRRRTGTGLSAMLLPELQALASQLGIPGVGRLRKGQLIAAIQNVQRTPGSGENGDRSADAEITRDASPAGAAAGGSDPLEQPAPRTRSRRGASRASASPAADGGRQGSLTDALPGPRETAPRDPAAGETTPPSGGSADSPPAAADTPVRDAPVRDIPVRDTLVGDAPVRVAGTEAPAETTAAAPPAVVAASGDVATAPERRPREDRPREDRRDRGDGERPQGERAPSERPPSERPERGERPERAGGQRQSERPDRGERSDRGDRNDRNDRNDRGDRGERNDRAGRQSGQRQNDRTGGQRQNDRADRADRSPSGPERSPGGSDAGNDLDDDGSGRRRGRFRERGRGRGARPSGGFAENEPVVREDDVLVPVAGILDVLDNYAFVRTSGYLAGPNDVYVSLAQVRRHGLRRGDAITGVVRAPQEGEARRDKYNALVRLDSVNGLEPDESRGRPEFNKLTPLYPQDRLRLETEPNVLTTRVIDLVMPIGKGQRALIVSPPKAGKTMVMQAIANAITTNSPECHLMVVLVDERPEEVTDMQRSVKGEVIASTFDRPPSDHTSVAELSIERAKRLVELGHDVVVLLDSITRLGRAYNLAAPASGRILSGGVDSTALYPPKRFLGAARNIENGGSLTILATALVETGSTMDTVIFEEFKGTGNAELKLDRKIADKRTFPAVDVDQSSTRKEEILLAPDELVIMHKLRRVLHTLEPQQALDLLLDQLKRTRTNYEFLMQIAKTTPGQD